ncbi:Ribonuclease P protein subunit p30 [Galdieria sulphuraria]|uniref:Ribonuclease P subunit Rpp3 n=1 Tax=Galdieria sulphuraria TaxID=130081 RepID=M2Y2K1_GALSU|nr:ribonuclease P subunit Rpp3 [Galdieria sulphuraria]EME30044.1 ribonuclease P subunit Rpp3 [Galdieria sulphuraria]GJD06257.1 Ribonuclease P protein subunit p30 [Galdieria sulphuraria]|eukprot:XP_005706564.1 ribonuclease P subunit Rpp3 [Galdieria sulphuraria]
MFVDLNVIQSDDEAKNQTLIQRLQQLGYDSFAFNKYVRGRVKREKAPKITKLDIPQGEVDYSLFRPGCSQSRQLQQLTRVTFIIDQQDDIHMLNSSNPLLRDYDIIAVQPATEKLLQQCLQFDIDMVTMALNERLPFYLKVPQVNVMKSKNIKFEICYSHLLEPSNIRQTAIANICSLMKTLKPELIIMSSGTEDPMKLRGPYDAMHMAFFWDMMEHHARRAISEIPMSTIRNANWRRNTFKGAVEIVSLEGSSKHTTWQFKKLEEWKANTPNDDNTDMSVMGKKRPLETSANGTNSSKNNNKKTKQK